ncbi:hypothetical protein JAAARDRAFT_39463 [Jaapia argillacea MUCL 33604]|uniref:F-box domain-containing protein n=1 Tax=Jaapia argillacea MUCL 33604 TaxID=933084 RepID=A0A067PSY5_9AGAM|nr:hypothetical protein JAAARDRAFT_39463 [Jaapia argillacea MUCL 33604]
MSSARVLSITELFREICWYLHDSPRHSGSLVSLARSSRSFLEPALDVLWYKLLHTEPLLKLLPALEVSKEETDNELVSYYDVSYPPEEQDWTRFDYYARRIRILDFYHEGEIDCAIYSRLARYTTSPNLIPSLRSLTWYHDYQNTSLASLTSEFSPFLSPSLQKLDIRNYHDAEDILWFDPDPTSSEDKETLLIFFHLLHRRCPSLQYLRLCDGDLRDVSFSFLSKFQNLKEVQLTGHSTKVDDLSITFGALSVLPHLEKIHDIEISTGPGVVSCTPGFPSLSHISTLSGNPTNILSIIQCISSPSFQSLSLQELAKGSNRDFLSFTSLLVSKFSTTLQRVIIHTTHGYPVEEVGLPIFETLSRGLPNLRTFGLTVTVDSFNQLGWPTMTDDQVERMTLAWPNMEDLTIQHSISLQSLKTIARAWTNLTSLTFSTLYIPTPELQLPLPKPRNTLRKLFVSTFQQSDPAAPTNDIAKVIHSMFPKLEVGFLARSCEVMRGVVALRKGRPLRL